MATDKTAAADQDPAETEPDSKADASETSVADQRPSVWRRVRTWAVRILLLLLVVVLILATIVLVRTWRFESRQPEVTPAPTLEIAVAEAAERLARSVQHRTISDDSGASGPEVYARFHQFLQDNYPKVHSALQREVVATGSLLYTWTGSEPDRQPIILVGHLDVVPMQPENADKWTHPPFAGVIADGFIWGRGVLDDKGAVLVILEAIEWLLGQGFQPRGTIYLAFGHDEELGGQQGAKAIAALLAQRGVRAAFVLDEGMFITRGVMKDIDGPLAAVGIAEKGYLTIELIAHAESGHSSIPPNRTAVGALAAAIARLETEQMPSRLSGPTQHMLQYLGPEMPFVQRMAMANLWLFEPFVRDIFAKKHTTASLVRTTTAPTMLQAGTKDNVLSATATGVINFRILPGDSVASVLAHVRDVIDDSRIEVKVRLQEEPSPVSDPSSPAFRMLHRTIREVFDDTVVAPTVMAGMTDARHYVPTTDAIFRFLPLVYGPDDLARLHGVNERIPVEDYGRAIQFYIQLLRNVQTM